MKHKFLSKKMRGIELVMIDVEKWKVIKKKSNTISYISFPDSRIHKVVHLVMTASRQNLRFDYLMINNY
jgi:hypothetical protein